MKTVMIMIIMMMIMMISCYSMTGPGRPDLYSAHPPANVYSSYDPTPSPVQVIIITMIIITII